MVGVTDGDTITVLRNGRHEALRLHGIDAPEKGQAFGERAKQFTSGLAFGKTVVVRVKGRDRYGRTIGDVSLPDGRNLNQEVVRAGYAWWYRRYSADQRLAVLEAEARADTPRTLGRSESPAAVGMAEGSASVRTPRDTSRSPRLASLDELARPFIRWNRTE